MRILVVIWSIQIGGAETFAIELCKYLKDRGYRPYLFPVFGSWDEKYYNYIRSLNISILSPFKKRIWNWFAWKLNALSLRLHLGSFREWLTIRLFNKTMTDYGIQLVLSNALIADLFVHKNLKHKIPRIVVEHGEYSYALMDKTEICWDGLFCANEIVCVSKWCERMLHQKNITIPTSVIYNGHRKPSSIDTYEGKLAIEPDDFIFGLLGRGIAYKGWEEAIKAFILVKENYPACKLVLIGEGEFLRALQNKYKDVSGIIFTGRLTKPAELIKMVHVGLVPSQKYEAFGITILDFFSQGKPVLATAVGAIPEVMSRGNRSGGILIPVDKEGRAVVRSLADQMIIIMKDKDLYQKASQQAAAIYCDFTFENTGKEYEKIIGKYIND